MKIIWGLFFTMFILCNLVSQPFIWSFPNEDSTVETSCYDRYQNEIQDLVCEETTIGVSFINKLIFSIITLLFSLFLCLYTSGDIWGRV